MDGCERIRIRELFNSMNVCKKEKRQLIYYKCVTVTAYEISSQNKNPVLLDSLRI